MDIYIDNGIWIPKNFPCFEAFKKELCVPNPQFLKAIEMGLYSDASQWYYCYAADHEGIRMPIGMIPNVLTVIKKYAPETVVHDNRITTLMDNPLEFYGQLRDYQERAIDQVQKFSCGILVSPAGSGKTVMALKMVQELGLRTMIFVHTQDLMEQWSDRCQDYLGVTPALLGAGSDCTGDITIGMLQTLHRRIKDTNFGMVIVDEVQHIPASTFKDVAWQFAPSKYYGLTATPYRSDKLDHMMRKIIGPVLHTVSDSALIAAGAKITPRVVAIPTSFRGELRSPKHWQRLYTDLSECQNRNESIVANCLNEPSKFHLILTKRVAHAKELCDRISVFAPNDVALCIGEMNKNDRKATLDAIRDGSLHYVVATDQLAAEALDVPRLDRLHIAMPTAFSGRVIQSIGRIQRPFDGKNDAVVYDYVDRDSNIMMTLFNKRKWDIYNDNGWKVEWKSQQRI